MKQVPQSNDCSRTKTEKAQRLYIEKIADEELKVKSGAAGETIGVFRKQEALEIQ